MKNPLVASITGVALTVCLFLVTGLNAVMTVLARAALRRDGVSPLHTRDGELLTGADLDQAVRLGGIIWGCAGAAVVFSVLLGILAVRGTRPISPALALVPAALVVVSAALPLVAGLRTGAMFWVFALLALAATLAQARAVATSTTR